jgi:hypothetical protein
MKTASSTTKLCWSVGLSPELQNRKELHAVELVPVQQRDRGEKLHVRQLFFGQLSDGGDGFKIYVGSVLADNVPQSDVSNLKKKKKLYPEWY